MDLAWQQANRQQLLNELAQLKQQLAQHIQAPVEPIERLVNITYDKITELDGLPSALAGLCVQFGLSYFERQLLLLCLGMELANDFAELCAQALPNLSYPTPALAMSAFSEGYWQAFDSQAPLFYWQLLEFGEGTTLATKRLYLNERTLRYLLGIASLDNRLVALLKPLPPAKLSSTVQTAALQQLLELWSGDIQGADMPCVNLYGSNVDIQEQLAHDLCLQLGLQSYRLPLAALTNHIQEMEQLKRLLIKEAYLSRCFYLIDCRNLDAQAKSMLAMVLEELKPFCLLLNSGPLTDFNTPVLNLAVPSLTTMQQVQLWQQLLTEANNPGSTELSQLAIQFSLNPRQINMIATTVNSQPDVEPERIAKRLWDFCRQQSRSQLDARIKLIEPKAGWDNLILPEAQKDLLHSIAAQIQQRYKVYQDWGFAAKKNNKGLGICVLFAGLSGTGKTLAAEVLAKELELDLYQVDLSAVVSKYIGETEKNLEQVFSAAERGGAVLLFDEADALFGKRSEVKDSRDRYANMEVSYLLQRIEAYQGLSILTTNLKSSMDEAFLRRFRFVADFDFPSVTQRLQIWQQIFPAQVQLQDVDFERLATLNITGGNIANIALNAAFYAAQQGQAINMTHIRRAVNDEYLKLQQILTERELPNS